MEVYSYRFRLLLEPSSEDLRPFAPLRVCLAVFNDFLQEGLSSKEYSKLKKGKWIERRLTSDEVARFHQHRREASCCSRIKWEMIL